MTSHFKYHFLSLPFVCGVRKSSRKSVLAPSYMNATKTFIMLQQILSHLASRKSLKSSRIVGQQEASILSQTESKKTGFTLLRMMSDFSSIRHIRLWVDVPIVLSWHLCWHCNTRGLSRSCCLLSSQWDNALRLYRQWRQQGYQIQVQGGKLHSSDISFYNVYKFVIAVDRTNGRQGGAWSRQVNY